MSHIIYLSESLHWFLLKHLVLGAPKGRSEPWRGHWPPRPPISERLLLEVLLCVTVQTEGCNRHERNEVQGAGVLVDEWVEERQAVILEIRSQPDRK